MEYAKKALDTKQWLQFLRENLDKDVDKHMDWELWLYKPGMPPIEVPKNKLIEDCERAADLCKKGDGLEEFKDLYQGFIPKQSEYFFRLLWHSDEPLKHSTLDKIEEIFQFSTSKNARIRLGFSIICLKAKYERFIDSVFEFLNTYGVMKFVRPMYKLLAQWPEQKERAIANFLQKRASMYPTTAKMIASDLAL
ncbi:Leukotriene A-4 hydrolase [Cichlidogyrus casuarinus]|uniref:Leukotriene A-4 hydrolase n=1 Tax=Cichlidogyrus casuarinus TaxID=1844966 RepID=A0ABD2QL06_9PLAT